MNDPTIPARFEVLDEIAHGEGEILLRARDTLLQREVVLRRPAPELARTWPDAKMRAAELRSARALAQVGHKGVVRLLDVLETPDGALVVLEPVAGESLAEIAAREGRIDPARIQQIGRDLAEALGAVHGQGVVHRGVSAANVIVRADGSPCLAGFVFAKFVDRDAPQSSIQFRDRSDAGAPVALPPHPAPEQVAGQSADARADLFALGWVLYEALTGKPPYPRDREPETWTDPVDPTKLVPGMSKALGQALLRCLKRNPAQRFASAAELGAALAIPAAGPASVGGAPAESARPSKSRLAPVLAAGGVLAAGIVAVILMRGDGRGAAAASGRGLAQPDEPVSKAAGANYGDSFTKSYALLIGIQDYSGTGWKDLPNAESDVRALESQLLATKAWEGWDVKTLTNKQASKRAIKEALADLAEATQDPETRVFLYYAGHGDKDKYSDSDGFIVPADARPIADDKSRDSYLLYQEGWDFFFNRTKAKHVLLALDCCYGGGVEQRRGGGDQPTDKLLRRKAHLVFASSLKDESASDGVTGGHSPFAQAFLDTLKDPTRRSVTSSDLCAAITNALRDSPTQTPNLGYRAKSGGDGQFVFFTQRP